MTFPNLIILKPPRSPYRKPCVHQAARLLACVKTADLLTIAQFSGMTCVKKRFIAHITTVFTKVYFFCKLVSGRYSQFYWAIY